MAKSKKKLVPDDEVEKTISKKAPKRGKSEKTLEIILKPLSKTGEEKESSLDDSSLRSPLEALLLHEFASHKVDQLPKNPSDDNLICMIKELISGYDRHNYDFLKRRESYDKDLGLLSSILTDVLPSNESLKRLIARALFEDKHELKSEGPSMAKSHIDYTTKEPAKEVLGLLK